MVLLKIIWVGRVNGHLWLRFKLQLNILVLILLRFSPLRLILFANTPSIATLSNSFEMSIEDGSGNAAIRMQRVAVPIVTLLKNQNFLTIASATYALMSTQKLRI